MAELRDVCNRSLEKWGLDLQIVVLIEELSELAKELCKWERLRQLGLEKSKHSLYGSIADEIADVEIMIEQVKIGMALHHLVNDRRKFKIDRLHDRILEDKNIEL